MCQTPFYSIPWHQSISSQSAASSGNATQSAWSKLSLQKTVPCLKKRELQFLNNQDPTHNFSSTLTTKSVVPADTDCVSTGIQSRSSPALMSQSMTKESAENTKLPPILVGAILPGWCPTGSTVRTNKKKLFSICFHSAGLGNNSNNLLSISQTLLFCMSPTESKNNLLTNSTFVETHEFWFLAFLNAACLFFVQNNVFQFLKHSSMKCQQTNQMNCLVGCMSCLRQLTLSVWQNMFCVGCFVLHLLRCVAKLGSRTWFWINLLKDCQQFTTGGLHFWSNRQTGKKTKRFGLACPHLFFCVVVRGDPQRDVNDHLQCLFSSQ